MKSCKVVEVEGQVDYTSIPLYQDLERLREEYDQAYRAVSKEVRGGEKFSLKSPPKSKEIKTKLAEAGYRYISEVEILTPNGAAFVVWGHLKEGYESLDAVGVREGTLFIEMFTVKVFEETIIIEDYMGPGESITSYKVREITLDDLIPTHFSDQEEVDAMFEVVDNAPTLAEKIKAARGSSREFSIDEEGFLRIDGHYARYIPHTKGVAPYKH